MALSPASGSSLNLCDTLQAHMQPLHKLGNANTVANYHKYYQI